MSGLSVLYAKEAATEASWPLVSAKNRTKRLREVYWARRAEGVSRRKPFMGMGLTWRPDRSQLGRGMDDPGDGLLYRVRLFPQTEVDFDWIEVTEVFTTVPAKDIQGAMRAWNGIPGKHSVDLDQFLRTIPRGRPSSDEQRRAADQAVAQIRKKLAKGQRTVHGVGSDLGRAGSGVGSPQRQDRRARAEEHAADALQGAVVQEAPRVARTAGLDRATNVVAACVEDAGGSAPGAPPLPGERAAEKLRTGARQPTRIGNRSPKASQGTSPAGCAGLVFQGTAPWRIRGVDECPQRRHLRRPLSTGTVSQVPVMMD